MANPKDDASTNVDTVASNFAKQMTAEAAKIRKAAMDKLAKDGGEQSGAKIPVVTFEVSTSADKTSGMRTPAEQAALVSKGTSSVCWSAHMADRARDVIMKVDGKRSWQDLEDAFGDDSCGAGTSFDLFKKKWVEVRKSFGLKDAGGGDTWFDSDPFHVELPDSKVSRTDERAKACLEEYARLTREKNQRKNPTFERSFAKLLEPYFKDYEKK
jgi:hypothetical protein